MHRRESEIAWWNRLLAPYVDFLSLVYHEGRNVRYLAQGGYLDRSPYRRLIHDLPAERGEAWKTLQTFRKAAANKPSAKAAEEVFKIQFGITVEQLLALFENPNWRHAPMRGGNPWANITRAVIELRNALEQRDRKEASRLLHLIPLLPHSTGMLGEKLRTLDALL